MFVRIWRYRVGAAQVQAFELAYGTDGDWARLFVRRDGYQGTELLRDSGPEAAGSTSWITIDRWRERKDWDGFMNQYGDAYRALDAACAALTLEEEEIGAFVTA